jgi:hypothetical protein
MTSPAAEITTPRIVVEATSIPAKLDSDLLGMSESLSHEPREQGRDFVVILLKG